MATAEEHVAHDVVLRLLERRDDFLKADTILQALVRELGLFPYVNLDDAPVRDQIAWEYHRAHELDDTTVLHAAQSQVFHRLMDGENVVLSAPTSFGKSLLIDIYIAAQDFDEVVVVVPTLALVDETRRRLRRFSDRYKIITHPAQERDRRNLYVMTQERLLELDPFPSPNFFVLDEFYKLNLEQDKTRSVLLNECFYRLAKTGAQFYLLGPNIDGLTAEHGDALTLSFVRSSYTTVASDFIRLEAEPSREEALLALCHELDEPTIVFCASQASANSVARILADERDPANDSLLSSCGDWAALNYHEDWVYPHAIRRGVALHHGSLPRALGQFSVRAFNDDMALFLVCTSTLIEGVNTKAKNVIIFDNKIAKTKLDYFSFSNIRGRSGRMRQHYVGRVYSFSDAPQPDLPLVAFAAFEQNAQTPDSLLVQLEEEDLKQLARARVNQIGSNGILPLALIRESRGVDPAAQIRLAEEIDLEPRYWSDRLAWTHMPKY